MTEKTLWPKNGIPKHRQPRAARFLDSEYKRALDNRKRLTQRLKIADERVRTIRDVIRELGDPLGIADSLSDEK